MQPNDCSNNSNKANDGVLEISAQQHGCLYSITVTLLSPPQLHD
jgi:hypothetical protein